MIAVLISDSNRAADWYNDPYTRTLESKRAENATRACHKNDVLSKVSI